MYTFEALLSAMVVGTTRLVQNPEEANLFFIPHAVTCRVHECMAKHGNLESCADAAYDTILGPVLREVKRGRWWKRYNGADHVMAIGHGRGLALFP